MSPKKLWPTPHSKADRHTKFAQGGRPLLYALETEDGEPIETSQLPLLPEDSLASLYLWPGSEEARMMTAGSGLRCLESLRKSDQHGLLRRMLLASFTWASMIVYLTWKLKATPQKHILFQLVPSTPRTDGIDSSLWPTPMSAPESEASHNQVSGRFREAMAARMWRTPDASVTTGGAANAEDRKSQGHAIGLHDQVRMCPTPRTPRPHDSQGKAAGDNYATGGQLNPTWVEWLMGFPLGWTDSEHSETP